MVSLMPILFKLFQKKKVKGEHYSSTKIQQPPPWSVSSHKFQGKTLHQQKEYNLLRTQMMASTFQQWSIFK